MKRTTMTRFAALAAALGMTAALAGCGAAESGATAATAETATDETATEETAVDESQYSYLGSFDYSAPFDENGYFAGVTATDYVTLPEDYSDITIDASLGQVTDEDIANYIDTNVLASFATTEQVTDRAAADGDTVNIDYVGSIDGVEFDGGNTQGNGADLTLGSGTYIDNFEEQIVGHMPGDEFEVTVTFPENYGNEELNGKEAVFKTTLNYISETVNPELTDEWVAENMGTTMNLNTVDELTDFVKNTMLYDQQAGDIYTALHDKVSYAKELPAEVTDYYKDLILLRLYSYAQQYGTSMTNLLAAGVTGQAYDSIDAYLADMQGSVNTISEQALLMQALAEKQGLTCTDELLNQDFHKFYGSSDPSRYVSAYGENYVKMNMVQSEVMQNLIDNVKYK